MNNANRSIPNKMHSIDSISDGTDSGRCSDNYENIGAPPTVNRSDKLRIVRDKSNIPYGYDKFSNIAHSTAITETTNDNKPKELAVVRRRNRNKKKDIRRNTIDVNRFDLEKASREIFKNQQIESIQNSKSTDYLDKITTENAKIFCDKIDQMRLCGLSSPDVRHIIPKSKGAASSRNYISTHMKKSYSEESVLIPVKTIGPEFIIKSSFPSKKIDLCDLNNPNRKIIHIILLDGRSIYIGCNSYTTTAYDILEAIVHTENLIENYFFGLCTLMGGDFIFLPSDLKVYKVAPQYWLNAISKNLNSISNVFFTLFLRMKFFLPTIRGIRSTESCHFLYLQLRKSLLEKQILCSEDDLILLGGLALQAEVGDFNQNMKYSEYFTISHYLPENFTYNHNKIDIIEYLRNSHYCRQGLKNIEAEKLFIKYIQGMNEYGFHLYSAIWTTDDNLEIDVYIGIALFGIAIFERKDPKFVSNQQPSQYQRKNCLDVNNIKNSKDFSMHKKLFANFEWLEIENLCYSKHILCIVVRKPESLKAKDNNRVKYKFRMEDKKSYFAFSLASEHHQFYMRLRNSFLSLKIISNELNIPIRTTANNQIVKKINDDDTVKINDVKNLNKYQEDNGKTILDKDKIDKGKQQSNNKTIDMFTSPNNQCYSSKTAINESTNFPCSIPLGNPSKREKTTKKSMSNDNRLMKFKEKFLRRSKSTVGFATEQNPETNNKKLKKFREILFMKQNKPNQSKLNENSITTNEENQNKENENPKELVNENNFSEAPSPTKSSSETEFSIEDPIRYYSPNRNRVKMGTRVFYSQFCNKSYDNIYDRFSSQSNEITTASSHNTHFKYDENEYAIIKSKFNKLTLSPKNDIQLNESDNTSSHNTSTYSMNYNKPDKRVLDKSIISNNGEQSQDNAYVIYSSINCDNNINFSLQNDSISQSLLDKFNNISYSNSYIENERVLVKLKVTKEYINNSSSSNNNNNNINANNVNNNINNNNNSNNLCEYNEPIYESLNKYKNSNQENYEIVVNQEKLNKYLRNNDKNDLKIKGMSKSYDNIFDKNISFSLVTDLEQNENENNYNKKLTLGISIVQGLNDNNVYVKDLIKGGPGEKAGIQIGDQIMSVDGISLLNLPYNDSLKLLQNTGSIVELLIAQINSFKKNLDEKIINQSSKNNNNIINNIYNNNGNNDKNIITNTYPINNISSSTLFNFNLNNNKKSKSYLTEHIYNNDDKNMKFIKNSDEFNSNNEFNKNIYLNLTNNVNIEQQLNDSSVQHLNEHQNNNKSNLDRILMTKSLPNFSKIPEAKINEDEEQMYATVLKKNQRKYQGPVKYPVTPIKPNHKSLPSNGNLSVFTEDNKVFI